MVGRELASARYKVDIVARYVFFRSLFRALIVRNERLQVPQELNKYVYVGVR